jgi:N-acetylglutamate synthase-like GNAT family acetyltransferase
MEVRPYLASDRDDCLAVFDSNAARGFFGPAARGAFEVFLENPAGPYLVLEHDGRIVGCGGYRVDPDQPAAVLSWGMIHYDLHRNGLGRYLLLYRLKEIGRAPFVQFVVLETPPQAAPFFEKFAFRPVESQETDAGLVRMRMKLKVCP